MFLRRVLLAAMLLTFLVGCGRKDLKRVADTMVENEILKNATRVEAIKFFEEDGCYFDGEDDEVVTAVDRDVLLPMLKRLKEIHRSEQWVVPSKDDPKRAHALLIELPSDKKVEDAMAKIVEEADQKFDGLILQQWGHRWLSIDMLDKETYEEFKKSDPNIDKQR